jgi:CPA2 family monovalent cation:H+ antiporter-2
MGFALLKAAVAFVVAVLLARLVVRPLFGMIARTRNEEVFTAMALLGRTRRGVGDRSDRPVVDIGCLSRRHDHRRDAVSAENPVGDQAVSRAAGGFFFISVGLSLDLGALIRLWPTVIGAAVLLLVVKIMTNAAASLVFRWSVPGSTQLGFLLAQGSEFAFVILSLPAVRALVGETTSAVLIAAVALSLAVTPSLGELGRSLAGRMRRRAARLADPELQPREDIGPVLIAGMGRTGRTLADALTEFDIGYAGIERDQQRLREAVADGYNVAFGDLSDPRIWEPVALHGRKVSVLTAPVFEVSRDLGPTVRQLLPNLKRVAVVHDRDEAERFKSIGVVPIVDRSVPPGLDVAALVLGELGVDRDRIGDWMRRQQERALSGVRATAA